MHVKKVLSDSKEKNKLAILECWSILKEKNKNVSKFTIAIMKQNYLVFILIIFHVYKYLHLENSINNKQKKFSFTRAIENLNTFLFFSFKIDHHSKIASLFFSFDSDKTFLACTFRNAYLFLSF
jgi:hypothetical protein